MDTMDYIEQARQIALSKGMNQSAWSEAAGHAINGQTVSRIRQKGDCRLSTFLSLLDAIGCGLEIKEL